MAMDTSNLWIAGDFNMHMDEGSQNDTKHFLAILKAADLTQHVEERRHTAGRTIDLLTTRSADTFLANIIVDVPHISDHSAVHCTLRLEKPPNLRLKKTSRNYKHVCVAAICEDMRSLRLPESLSDDMDYAANTYNTCLTATIDKHAPIKT